jgi:hypothetical protein
MSYLYRYLSDGTWQWRPITGELAYTLGPDRVLCRADDTVVVTDVDLDQAMRTLRQLGHALDQTA